MHRFFDTHAASGPADEDAAHEQIDRRRSRKSLPEATGILVGALLGAGCWLLLIAIYMVTVGK